SVADRYDVMNDLMSLGIHRLWKRHFVSGCGIRDGQQVLDLAGGTGDIADRVRRKVGPSGRVCVADINHSMLMAGRRRMDDLGQIDGLSWLQVNGEALPFADRQFDHVTIAFGLRNFTDKAAGLSDMYRVLKPGGRIHILEFSQVSPELLAKLYDLWSFQVLPRMGQLVANDRASYQYLAESIRRFPDQSTLVDMLLEAGFERAGYENLSGGIAAIHRAARV
ncbi:MAG: bifunctional demethylmenaquinone methyltransferase/2-methoxy-6-polyprenyl-1,4-benzoquinol methylase UbiE, partial [Pseudomonadota bacterium]